MSLCEGIRERCHQEDCSTRAVNLQRVAGTNSVITDDRIRAQLQPVRAAVGTVLSDGPELWGHCPHFSETELPEPALGAFAFSLICAFNIH
jgi:hypothetical protein